MIDYVLPVPDLAPEGREYIEMTIPKWVVHTVDTYRNEIGQSREEFLLDCIIEKVSELGVIRSDRTDNGDG